MIDAPSLFKIPKSEKPDIWIRIPKHKLRKSWPSMEDTVVLLVQNPYGHPLAGLLWERQFGKVPLEHGWEKVPDWECQFVNRERRLLLSVYVDGIKPTGKKENIDPTRNVLIVDLDETTSFLNLVYLECTQKRMPKKQRYGRQLQRLVWIKDLRKEPPKNNPLVQGNLK